MTRCGACLLTKDTTTCVSQPASRYATIISLTQPFTGITSKHVSIMSNGKSLVVCCTALSAILSDVTLCDMQLNLAEQEKLQLQQRTQHQQYPSNSITQHKTQELEKQVGLCCKVIFFFNFKVVVGKLYGLNKSMCSAVADQRALLLNLSLSLSQPRTKVLRSVRHCPSIRRFPGVIIARMNTLLDFLRQAMFLKVCLQASRILQAPDESKPSHHVPGHVAY